MPEASPLTSDSRVPGVADQLRAAESLNQFRQACKTPGIHQDWSSAFDASIAPLLSDPETAALVRSTMRALRSKKPSNGGLGLKYWLVLGEAAASVTLADPQGAFDALQTLELKGQNPENPTGDFPPHSRVRQITGWGQFVPWFVATGRLDLATKAAEYARIDAYPRLAVTEGYTQAHARLLRKLGQIDASDAVLKQLIAVAGTLTVETLSDDDVVIEVEDPQRWFYLAEAAWIRGDEAAARAFTTTAFETGEQGGYLNFDYSMRQNPERAREYDIQHRYSVVYERLDNAIFRNHELESLRAYALLRWPDQRKERTCARMPPENLGKQSRWVANDRINELRSR